MNEIRIGIAGLGHRALHWIRLLQRIPGYRITAIYDWIEPLHGRALVETTYADDVRAFSDYDDFLTCEEMDAVGLCARQKDQGAMAVKALQAGKHLNSEVPACYRMQECWQLVTLVEQTGLVYSLAEQTRFWGFVDDWQSLVAQGRLGKVTYAEGQYVGYYGTHQYFQDYQTGEQYPVEQLADHPEAEPTFMGSRPTIYSASYDLSILLKVLDDRVKEVTAMSTQRPSYACPEIGAPDVQVALMKTEKDTLIRMLNGFTQPRPHGDHHWWQMIGTKGSVEWRRSRGEMPKLWLADGQMHEWSEVDWRFERTNAPGGARGSGHGDADYYVHAFFRDAVLEGRPLEFDVYRAMDTMAPAIMAAESIEQDSQPLPVPDFRPGERRKAGEMPRESWGPDVAAVDKYA